mmetsp:Transcript_14650/g.59784  ORF Transcript_14650/g.59784 Transcript_14650/m.59784 type:complete len:459 (-) Transcript_14650:3942-5318(-)
MDRRRPSRRMLLLSRPQTSERRRPRRLPHRRRPRHLLGGGGLRRGRRGSRGGGGARSPDALEDWLAVDVESTLVVRVGFVIRLHLQTRRERRRLLRAFLRVLLLPRELEPGPAEPAALAADHQSLLLLLGVLIRHRLEVAGHGLLRVRHRLDEIRRELLLFRRDERDGSALVTRAARSSHPVHVILQVVRSVVVDDEPEVLHVEPARGDGCGDEDVAHVRFEIRDGALAVRLLLPAVQGQAGITASQQVPKHLVALVLTRHEDDDLSALVPLSEELEHAEEPVLLRAHLHDLLDVRIHHRPAAHLNLHRVRQRAPRQCLHRVRKRRAEHHRLSVRSEVVHDPRDLRLKAHVEHAIRLVEHHVRHPSQVGDSTGARRQHVDHSPRRARDNLAPAFEFSDLRRDSAPAVHGHRHQTRGATKLFAILANLRDQLSRRAHDHADRAVAALDGALVLDVPQHG